MDFVSIIMLVLVFGAIGVGLYMARFHINKDVKTLYATRPLSNQQIDSLNQQLIELKKTMFPNAKST